MVPTVIGHDLDDFLFSNNKPSQFLINGDPNLAYSQWKRKDQLLLSWLRSSMTEAVLATVASHTSSFSVWKALEQRFSSQSKARLLQLKGQLCNIQKGNLTISDYIDKIKSLCDNLAIAGYMVNDDDLELQLLNGLGPEYDPVVSGITSSSESKSLEEIQALLMAHECRLERHNSVADLTSKFSANLTIGSSRSNNPGTYRPPFQNNRGTSYDHISRTGSRPYNRFSNHSNSRPLCQVCLKLGHTAAICHYRFDKSFVTP